jgi:hypothetical protein
MMNCGTVGEWSIDDIVDGDGASPGTASDVREEKDVAGNS